MKVQNRKTNAWLRFFAALLLCGVFITLGFGTALARFEKSQSEEVVLEYKAKTDQVYIRSIEEPVSEDETDTEITGDSELEEENVYEMYFELSNGISSEDYCTYDQIAALSLFATVGLKNPENYTITLTGSGLTYTASCFEVVEGTTLYSLYGPGWVYRFYNKAGEELTWELSGSQFINRQMKLTVTGTSELPAALSLIASAKPGKV